MVASFSIQRVAVWILLRLLAASAALGVTPTAQARIKLTRDDLANVASGSKRHVDLMLPSLQDANLVDRLRAVARSGRQVRILLSTKEADLSSWVCLPCTSLETDGALIRYLENVVLDTFMVIDGPRSRFSSGNHAELAVQTGRTARSMRLLRFTAEGDYVLNYQQEFNALWSKALDYGQPKKSKTHAELRSAGGPFVLFSSANMSPIKLKPGRWSFTPTLDEKAPLFATYLSGAIDYAYDEIDIGAYGLSRPEILSALGRALSRGVKVRILLEDAVTPELHKLALSGATIVSLASLASNGKTPRLPANILVIDRKTAMTGSFAWSRTSELNAFSSLVTLQGPVVQHYRKLLNSGFEKTRARLPLTSVWID